MKLILVRHGQTDLNKQFIVQGRSNYPLNETGINDAIKSSEVIFNEIKHIDVFISSPLTRAVQTTTIIAKKFGFKGPIITDEHFYERDFGPYDGKLVRDVFPVTMFPKGYEKDNQLQERVLSGVVSLFEKYPNKTVLVGCHSHTIKAILTQVLDNYTFSERLENGAAFIFNVTKDKITLIKELNNY